MSTVLHKKDTPKQARIAVISVSTTRGIEQDKSGAWIKKQARNEGHEVVVHHTVTDEVDAIKQMLSHVIDKIGPDLVIMSGGTGISPKDVTIEAVKPMFAKELSAFSVLFAQLSFEEIDSAAILSRATAGVIRNTLVFCIPGSEKACRLACTQLIFPEIGHLLKHMKE